MIVEGAGSKPLFVHHSAGCIQLSIRPVPRRRSSTELFGLAPVGVFVPSVNRRPRPFGFIAHTCNGSFLLHCRPSRILGVNRATCGVERGLSSVSCTVSNPPAPSCEGKCSMILIKRSSVFRIIITIYNRIISFLVIVNKQIILNQNR